MPRQEVRFPQSLLSAIRQGFTALAGAFGGISGRLPEDLDTISGGVKVTVVRGDDDTRRLLEGILIELGEIRRELREGR